MAVIIIDLVGDEDDGFVTVVDKNVAQNTETKEKRNAFVPQSQLEIVPIIEEKVKAPRSRRLRKTNIHGQILS